MKTSLRAAAVALFGLCTAGITQGPTLYIDPVAGVDAVGGGSATNPLRTMTFAIGVVGPTGPATFRLRPGVFIAPAEIFPMVLPDVCVVEADPALLRGAQSVVITGHPKSAGHTPALQVGGSGLGPVDVTLRNLVIEGSCYNAVQIDGPVGTGTLNFLAEDCVMNHYRDLVVLTTGNTVATVTAVRCTMRGLDKQVEVTARATSVVSLAIDRGLLSGAWIGVDLIAITGTILAQLRCLRFVDEGLHGVRLGTTNNGVITLRAEHCLFRKSGTRTIGLPTGDLGAITEDPAGRMGTRTVLVENSLFSGNVNDCPHLGVGSYAFGANIVQQPNLIGLGGNFNATVQFADVQGSDFHLLPISPAIDAGVASASTLPTDYEGDPRPNGSAPDLGPDEHHALYFYAQGAAHIGGPWPVFLRFRALGPPGIAFAGFMAFGQTGAPWGPGQLYLLQPISGLMFLGTIGSNGLGESGFYLPVAPAFIGLETWWQGGFGIAPYFGINVHRVVMRA